MKTLKTILVLGILFISFGAMAQNDDDKRIMADAENAKTTMMAADASLGDFFNNSAGYVIFPNVGKGGFIIGAAAGNGVLYENGIAQGMAKLKKLSVGLQAGGQAISEIIFFENEAALNSFKDGDFEFAAGISAVVLKSGKAETAQYKEGVAVFALPKAGLMAEASVGGQKFSYDSF
jgi:lipid-binding SYLF domain-containing protein